MCNGIDLTIVPGDRPSRYGMNLARRLLPEHILSDYRLSPQKSGDSSRPPIPEDYSDIIENIKGKSQQITISCLNSSLKN